MTTRLDLTLKKYPSHEEGIHLLALRDPSGNFKYLDWGAKMLAAGQALAPEVADVIELFHQFGGHRRHPNPHHSSRQKPTIRPDIYTYRPQDLASLRDNLLKLQRAKDRKRRERERLYRIEGEMETDVVYDASDLVVRHIKNKQASVHHGLGTKWCISMLREGHFEDYEAQNATFFFFERKTPQNDEFDKMALMLPRGSSWEDGISVFTSADRRLDVMALAKVYGSRVFDIFREIYERSERYPGSTLFRIYDGSATQEQLESVFASLVSGSFKLNSSSETESLLESMCCNDAASLSLLEEIKRRAPKLSLAAWNRCYGRRGRRHVRRVKHSTKELERVIASALFVHPAVPFELREQLREELRKRKVAISNIHRTKDDGRACVSYLHHHESRVVYRHRRRRRALTVSAMQAHVRSLERRIVRTKKWIEKAEEKKAKAKRTRKKTKAKR